MPDLKPRLKPDCLIMLTAGHSWCSLRFMVADEDILLALRMLLQIACGRD